MTTHFVTFRPSSDPSDPGGVDRLADFQSWEDRLDGWSASSSFIPGDIVVYYFASPLRSIVAIGVVDSDPYFEEIEDPGDFRNPTFCDVYPFWHLKTPIRDTEIKAHPVLRDWWSTTPFRSIRKIAERFTVPLMDLIVSRNPGMERPLAKAGCLGDQKPDSSSGKSPRTLSTSIEPPPSPDSVRAKAIRRERRWTQNDLCTLDCYKFEEIVAELFKLKYGYTPKLTPKTGDNGVDAFLAKTGAKHRHLLQCKRFRLDIKVSSPHVQTFLGAVHKYKAPKAYLVTSSGFNSRAIDYARGTEIELIDGATLTNMLNESRIGPPPAKR